MRVKSLGAEGWLPVVVGGHYRKPEQERSKNMRGHGKPQRRKKARAGARAAKKDPIFVDGARPRPMYVDYKDIDLLKKLVNRHGRIVGRRKSGCSAVSQHAVTKAVKRARFMALLPFVGN